MATPSQAEPTKLSMTICGLRERHDIVLPANMNVDNAKARERNVLHALGVETGYALMWHLKAEDCSVQRPFIDLRVDPDGSTQAIAGKSLKIHLVRATSKPLPAAFQGGSRSQTATTISDHGQESGESITINTSDALHEVRGGPSLDTDMSSQSIPITAVATTAVEEAVTADHRSPASEESMIEIPQVVVRFALSHATLAGLSIEESDLPDVRLEFNLDNTMDDVFNCLDDAAHDLLRACDKFDLVRQNLPVIRTEARFTAAQDRHPADFQNSVFGARFPTLADFFQNPHVVDHDLVAELNLRLPPDLAGPTSPRKRKRLGKDVEPSGTALELYGSMRQQSDDPEYLRIGVTKSRTQKNKGDIPVEYPIIAEVVQGQQKKRKLKQLWETDCWDFDDHAIGGLNLSKQRIETSSLPNKRYTWYDGFKGTKSGHDLERLVSNPVATDPRVPFMPPLTCNVFDPNLLRPDVLGSKAGSGAFAVAVRFVGHLDDMYWGIINFHDNYQLSANDKTSVRSIEQEIFGRLSREKDTKILFAKPLVGAWTLELWALPHQPAPQKLHKFGPPGSTDMLLKQFVNPERLKDGHRKLYMEAHLWPKQDGNIEPEDEGRFAKQPPARKKKEKHVTIAADASESNSTEGAYTRPKGVTSRRLRARKSALQGGSRVMSSQTAAGGRRGSAISNSDASSSGLSSVPDEDEEPREGHSE